MPEGAQASKGTYIRDCAGPRHSSLDFLHLAPRHNFPTFVSWLSGCCGKRPRKLSCLRDGEVFPAETLSCRPRRRPSSFYTCDDTVGHCDFREPLSLRWARTDDAELAILAILGTDHAGFFVTQRLPDVCFEFLFGLVAGSHHCRFSSVLYPVYATGGVESMVRKYFNTVRVPPVPQHRSGSVSYTHLTL